VYNDDACITQCINERMSNPNRKPLSYKPVPILNLKDIQDIVGL